MAVTEIWQDTRGRGQCRSCGAALTWAENVKTGRRMPFNGDLVALKTRHDPDTRRVIEEVDLGESHFATCPDADTFRRRKPGGAR